MSLELKEVDSHNIWEIIQLSVSDEQKGFVATNTVSILEAYTTITAGGIALPFGIYDDKTPVGFLMIGYGCEDWEDAPAIAHGTYSIWRFMIDKRYQNKGYGKKAMEATLSYIKTFPCGESKYCWLSYNPENWVAKKLYQECGFEENGEWDGNEQIAVLKL